MSPTRHRNDVSILTGIVLAMCLGLGSRTVAAEPRAASPARVRLRSGDLDPSRWPLASPSAFTNVPGPSTQLLYYGTADPERVREAVQASGGRVVAYLPDHTFLVRLSAGVPASLDARVRAASYEPAFKIDPRCWSTGSAPVVQTVALFPDADVRAVADAVRADGVEVVLESDGADQLLRVRADTRAVESLARRPEVAWIEPFVAPLALNDRAQGLVQTGVVGDRRLWDLGLHGEGQIIQNSDSGLNMNHVQFQDLGTAITGFGDFPGHRKVIAYRRLSADPRIAFGDHGSFHGTHTSGTLAGNDDWIAGSPYDGIAKDARLFFVDLAGPAVGDTMLTPADLGTLFQLGFDGNAGGAARISSNSWGSPVDGVYTTEAHDLDRFVWEHPDYLVVVAAGNDGEPGTINSPGTAKNCLTVGATWNGPAASTLSVLTSRGPTSDGRIKPTLCSPGQTIASSTTGTASYDFQFGTSMATATAAGAVALIRQYLVEGWYPTGAEVPANGFTPSAALLRAMAVNAATNVVTSFNAPDMNVGWGRIDADSVLYFAGDARRLLLVDQRSGLGHGQSIEYQVNVVDGSQPLEASLCWTDYPGAPISGGALVNDLNLTVTNGVTTYRGNAFAGGLSTTGGIADGVNVEEGVRIANPATGLWTVRVDGANVPFGPQGYGLVVTGGVGTTAGALALDRASYGASATVNLRVVDTDAGSSVNVTVTSPTEPAGETVTLTGANGVLTGSIALTAAAASADGALSVADGDVVTATYVDTSPAATVTSTAVVNTTPPAISSVAFANAGNGAVRVTWSTATSASSRVDFGPTPSLGGSASDLTAVTGHAVVVSGLDLGRRYYFDVESRDLEGNVMHDDNGGAHYTFTTAVPAAFDLGPSVPNPVASTGTVQYALPVPADVDLVVCDVTGRRVRSLASGRAGPGVFTATWDRHDDGRRLVSAGIYYYVLVVSGETFSRRVVVLE